MLGPWLSGYHLRSCWNVASSTMAKLAPGDKVGKQMLHRDQSILVALFPGYMLAIVAEVTVQVKAQTIVLTQERLSTNEARPASMSTQQDSLHCSRATLGASKSCHGSNLSTEQRTAVEWGVGPQIGGWHQRLVAATPGLHERARRVYPCWPGHALAPSTMPLLASTGSLSARGVRNVRATHLLSAILARDTGIRHRHVVLEVVCQGLKH